MIQKELAHLQCVVYPLLGCMVYIVQGIHHTLQLDEFLLDHVANTDFTDSTATSVYKSMTHKTSSSIH